LVNCSSLQLGELLQLADQVLRHTSSRRPRSSLTEADATLTHVTRL
jgi:hypothetical protein